jgi:preprotein translocase subunit SecD
MRHSDNGTSASGGRSAACFTLAATVCVLACWAVSGCSSGREKELDEAYETLGGYELQVIVAPYFCDVCSIGTDKAGRCACCGKELVMAAGPRYSIDRAVAALKRRFAMVKMEEVRVTAERETIFMRLVGADKDEADRIRTLAGLTGRLGFFIEAGGDQKARAKAPDSREPAGTCPQGTFWTAVATSDENGKTGQSFILLMAEPVMTVADIASVRPDFGGAGWVLNFGLTEDGGSVLAGVTGRNVGARLAVILDGRCISAQAIRAKMEGNEFVATGDFDREEIFDIATVLGPGAWLEAPLVGLDEKWTNKESQK